MMKEKSIILKQKIKKVDIWCVDDCSKGSIGAVNKRMSMPRDAKIAVKDAVSDIFFEDDRGRKQGTHKHFSFVLNHAFNPNVPEKGEEKIGAFHGRDVYRYLFRETSYKDNKRNGPEVGYFANSKISFITMFVDDKKNGVEIWYNPKGIRIRMRTHKDGKLDGYDILCDDNGVPGEYTLWENGETKRNFGSMKEPGMTEVLSDLEKRVRAVEKEIGFTAKEGNSLEERLTKSTKLKQARCSGRSNG